MKKVISREMENALVNVLKKFEHCSCPKEKIMELHVENTGEWFGENRSLSKLGLMELALLLDGQYEVEKTAEERLKEKRTEYQIKANINNNKLYMLEGFDEALKILGIDLKNS